MASQTLPTTVVAGANSTKFEGTSNVVIAQGQAVYRDTATRQYKLAQSNAAATAVLAGFALNSTGVINSPVDIIKDGILGGCSGLTVGQVFVLSSTVAGDIMLNSDLTIGNYISMAAVAISATEIQLFITNTGVTSP